MAQNSPLMRLAAELRNGIYRLVLVTDDPVYIREDNLDAHTAVLRTCKQIRTEAGEIFFGENKFEITAWDGKCMPALNWLTRLEKSSLQCITKLTIRFEVTQICYDAHTRLYNSGRTGAAETASTVSDRESMKDAKKYIKEAAQAMFALHDQGFPQGCLWVAESYCLKTGLCTWCDKCGESKQMWIAFDTEFENMGGDVSLEGSKPIWDFLREQEQEQE